MKRNRFLTAAALTLLTATFASAQTPGAAAPQQPQPAINTTPGPYLQNFGGVSTSFEPGQHRSDNIKLMAHVPLGTVLTISDIDVEQELSRPYAYVTRRLNPSGWDIISLKNINDANALKKAEVICRWRIENAELHQ